VSRAVFIDRDGIILHAPVEDGVPRPLRKAAEFAYLPGVAEALDLLRASALVPVTNQPVARGLTTRGLVEAFQVMRRRRYRPVIKPYCYPLRACVDVTGTFRSLTRPGGLDRTARQCPSVRHFVASTT
jgi:hypothetical protein